MSKNEFNSICPSAPRGEICPGGYQGDNRTVFQYGDHLLYLEGKEYFVVDSLLMGSSLGYIYLIDLSTTFVNG
jgi:hypothetical protein